MTLLTAALVGGIVAYVVTKSARQKKDRKRQRKALSMSGPMPALPPASSQTATGLVVPVPPQSLSFAPDCSVWSILDPSRFGLEIRFVYYGERLRGLADPYLLTDSVLAYIAPSCRGRGEQIRNLGELDLYAQVFVTVAELMFHEGLLDDESWVATANDFDAWYNQEAEQLSVAA